MKLIVKSTLLAVISILMATPVLAAEVTVAVAANFTAPMKQIAADFEKETGHKTTFYLRNRDTGTVVPEIRVCRCQR